MFTVFIAADMEGSSGYVNWPEKPPEESWFREQITAEVNAAIEGAISGGASEFIVSDIHWRKQNIIPDRLQGKASLIRGTKRRLMWMDMVERSNLVFLIGFHAGCGQPEAVLPHTIDTRITSLRINGVQADEAMISALTAGCFGVPVGLATGDKSFIDNVVSFLDNIEAVVVKEGIGCTAALNLHPSLIIDKIREAAFRTTKKGLNGLLKPYLAASPVEMVMEVNWPGYADALSLIPGVARHGGREISFQGDWLKALGIISLFIHWVSNMSGVD